MEKEQKINPDDKILDNKEEDYSKNENHEEDSLEKKEISLEDKINELEDKVARTFAEMENLEEAKDSAEVQIGKAAFPPKKSPQNHIKLAEFFVFCVCFAGIASQMMDYTQSEVDEVRLPFSRSF